METVEKQIQKEIEEDKQMAKRLSEVQLKLGKQKQKQHELEEKEKLESRENARLKKDLEALKKKNSEYSIYNTV